MSLVALNIELFFIKAVCEITLRIVFKGGVAMVDVFVVLVPSNSPLADL